MEAKSSMCFPLIWVSIRKTPAKRRLSAGSPARRDRANGRIRAVVARQDRVKGCNRAVVDPWDRATALDRAVVARQDRTERRNRAVVDLWDRAKGRDRAVLARRKRAVLSSARGVDRELHRFDRLRTILDQIGAEGIGTDPDRLVPEPCGAGRDHFGEGVAVVAATDRVGAAVAGMARDQKNDGRQKTGQHAPAEPRPEPESRTRSG
jgi:hypothetical protein